MKIGIVSPYNIFRPGGVQAVIEEIADEMRTRGHEVKVIAARPKGAKNNNLDVILLGQSTEFNTPFATKADAAISLDNAAVDAVLAAENFDLLHFHEPWIPMFSPQLLARSTAVNVATFHAKLPDGPVSKSFERLAVPFARSVFKKLTSISAVSVAAAEYVGSVSKLPIEIIPNGINLKHFDPKRVKPLPKYDDNKKTILYIGRLEKRKGVRFLLMAFRRLAENNKDVRLLIAGDGDKRAMLEDYVQEHNLTNVEFLGFVSDEDKLRLLKSADLFVSPALFGESFGIVLLEAMAMGVPVIAGNNAGYSSVMVDRGRMSLVDPKETQDFVQRMELFLRDDEMCQLWLSWAAKYVKQFDWPRVVDQYEQFYKAAIEAGVTS